MSADGGARANVLTADVMAALVQLDDAALTATKLGRAARAIELYERALAMAQAASLPHDSLILADMRSNVVRQRLELARHEGATSRAAWRSDEQLLLHARKTLLVCDARFRAGTFFTPTPEEVAFFDAGGITVTTHLPIAAEYVALAAEVLPNWPEPRTRDEAEVRLRIVGGALRATLEMDRRGMLDWRDPHTGQPKPLTSQDDGTKITFAVSTRPLVQTLLADALADASEGGCWDLLRTTCAVSAAEETALRQLADRTRVLLATSSSGDELSELVHRVARKNVAGVQQRAAADVARHGLRACALPECGAPEPEPKLFKVCGRCRAVCYCSAAHQDWRRHKRADGCKAVA
jgi:hypothetical protein